MSEHGSRRDSKDGLVRRRVNEHGVKHESPKAPQHRRSPNICDLEHKQLDGASRIFPPKQAPPSGCRGGQEDQEKGVEDKFFIPHDFISLATCTTSTLSWILGESILKSKRVHIHKNDAESHGPKLMTI